MTTQPPHAIRLDHPHPVAPPPPHRGRCGHQASVVDALDREWGRLARRRLALEGVDRWSSGDHLLDRAAHTQLDGARRFLDLVELTSHRRGADADLLLRWLIEVGRDEATAARVVLQRVLPLLVEASAQWAAGGAFGASSTAPPVDELVTTATIEIATYRPLPSHRHLAPRILSAAVHQAFRKHRRRVEHRREVTAVPTSFAERPAAETTLDGAVAVARMLAAGRAAGVDPALIDVARRLADGASTATIAVERSCTARAIRNHRTRIIRRLRKVLDDSWCEWDDPLVGIEFERR